jgi:hypothetical protein
MSVSCDVFSDWPSPGDCSETRFDLFVDMRPYFPCAWLLAVLSGAKVRAGFGLRGMSDAFHFILPYSASKRLGQIYLDALPSITGAGLIYERPILPSTRTRRKLVNDFGLPERYLAVQLSSRERARNIGSALWTDIGTLAFDVLPLCFLVQPMTRDGLSSNRHPGCFP